MPSASSLPSIGRFSGTVRQWLRMSGPWGPARADASDSEIGREEQLIYRLRSWPHLAEAGRRAEIYRMLSVMSHRPVNRQWVLSQVRMEPRHVDQLLGQLVKAGAVEVIDPSGFGPEAEQLESDPN
jgi:hypothetical protein